MKVFGVWQGAILGGSILYTLESSSESSKSNFAMAYMFDILHWPFLFYSAISQEDILHDTKYRMQVKSLDAYMMQNWWLGRWWFIYKMFSQIMESLNDRKMGDALFS